MQPQQRSILIVDTDHDILKNLDNHLSRPEFKLVVVPSGAQAQQLLSKTVFLAVAVNPKTCDLNGLSVVRCARHYQPTTQVFLLKDQNLETPYTKEEIKKLGIRSILEKPLEYSTLVQLIHPLTVSFDTQRALQKAKANKDVLGLESQDGNEKFLPILAENFLSGATSLFDVYVRIRESRYLKILQAGDPFTSDRIEGYLKKGITHFYMRKEIQEEYLEFCDTLLSKLLEQKNIPTKIKISQTFHHGNQVYQFFLNSGIHGAHIRHAVAFVENVRDLVEQLSSIAHVKTLLERAPLYDHAVGTSLLASVLGQVLEIEMRKPIQVLGLASFLHDISLANSSEVLLQEDDSKMSDEEKILFYSHAQKSSEIVRQISGIEPATVQAIAQHHSRLIPSTLNSSTPTRLHRLAEIVEISEAFDHFLRHNQNQSLSNLFQLVEKKLLPHFSRQITYAFRTAFFPIEKRKR